MTAEQYNKLNQLLSDFSVISASIEAAEAEIKCVQLAAAGPLLPKHAAAKVTLANLEADLRKLADAHYDELFPLEKKRSHATPFGSIKYHKSSSLEVEDEEKTILKIEVLAGEEMARAVKANRDPVFTAGALIRTRKELNIEALEGVDEFLLEKLGITRVNKDNFKVVPFDMAADKPAKKQKAA